ncbi:HAMP domain-containing sensor histidine kinase [Brevundimonas sp.]|uniref:sensor histidine kinase n=1 Tax=Brevundimonas sp. TaxID=1871086 RepID=UPI0028A6C5C7|nr:HAMP domain-containing sensor histidine kinase [Brevundimonas sp.]
MEREQALADMSSRATDTRLAAARWFSDNAVSEDARMLQMALTTESVPWITRALVKGLARAQRRGRERREEVRPRQNGSPLALPELEDLAPASAAKITERVTEEILHEISPLVASMKLAAKRELKEFDGSSTKDILDQMTRLLESMRNLNQASGAPKFETVVIHEVLQKVVGAGVIPEGVTIHLEGARELAVEADLGKLEIAVSNGLRNALDAVASFSSVTPATITFTWGVTAAEVWLAIKDSGPGFPGDMPSEYVRRGVTGKTGHPGHGLALVRAVMESMGGELIVANKAPGAHFEIRWYRRNANSSG